MVDLSEKTVVITGASSGIGKAAASAFARKGAAVVLAARREDKLRDIQDAILAFNQKCIFVKTDVTDEAQVAALFDRAEERFGRVDILINNAGRGLKAEVADIALEEWQCVVDTNLTSVFLCTRQAVRRMKSHNIRGHIITVSSIAGLFGAPTYSAYCASKHGVTGFCRALRWELRKSGIRVSTIFPARVDTEFFDTYKHRPGKRQMLAAADIAAHLVAIATQSPAAVLRMRVINGFKRILIFLGLI
ncbi:MAG: SDR family oxidoreductase [Phycisphaerae bacterium]|nr:SDR family oxidoreductase [Phycisphaerae bacterium]